MPDLDQVNQYQFVRLVNRTQETAEFIYDGARFLFKPGQTQTISAFVVDWLFRRDHAKIPTTDGDYVFRYGIEECPEEMMAQFPKDAFDVTPVERQTDAAEGWDTREVLRDPTKTQVKPLRPTRDSIIHQGVASPVMGPRVKEG